MSYLSDDIRAGLAQARRSAERKSSRLSVHLGDTVYPIYKLTDDGFSVDANRVPHLRGLVDIFDGPRQISRALIIAANEEDGEMRYDFKRESILPDRPIRDFVTERPAPDGYLPSPI